MRWYVQDEVNQKDSEQNEVDGMKKGVDSIGKVMHLMICVVMKMSSYVVHQQ